MKSCAGTLAPILTEIFRNSLDSGDIPSIWKKSIIIPLFKKGNKQNPNNYRPISLTSPVARTLERLIARDIINFLLTHHLLSENQFGFIKGRSTKLQLISTLNEWYTAINNKNRVVFI